MFDRLRGGFIPVLAARLLVRTAQILLLLATLSPSYLHLLLQLLPDVRRRAVAPLRPPGQGKTRPRRHVNREGVGVADSLEERSFGATCSMQQPSILLEHDAVALAPHATHRATASSPW